MENAECRGQPQPEPPESELDEEQPESLDVLPLEPESNVEWLAPESGENCRLRISGIEGSRCEGKSGLADFFRRLLPKTGVTPCTSGLSGGRGIDRISLRDRLIFDITPMTTANQHNAKAITKMIIQIVATLGEYQTRFGAASEKRPAACVCVSASASASAASGAGNSARLNIRCTIFATASFCAAP